MDPVTQPTPTFNPNISPPGLTPLPGATIPWGFSGLWTPPANYGVLEWPVNVSSGDWPTGVIQQSIFPQFATDKGQQIGKKFFLYGTYLGPPGALPGDPRCGFLVNQKTGSWPSQATRGVVGLGALSVGNPSISHIPITGQPYDVLPIPVAVPTSGMTNQQLRDAAVSFLQQMKF